MSLFKNVWEWMFIHPDTIINLFVAVGTVGLAVLTVFQVRLTLAREVSERVYAPLEPVVLGWTDPTQTPSAEGWKKLKDSNAWLVRRLPRRLFDRLNQIEGRIESLGSFPGRKGTLIRDQMSAFGATTFPKATSADWPDLWLKGDSLNERIDPWALWVMEMPLRAYAQSRGREDEDPKWYVETCQNSQTSSPRTKDLEVAEACVAKVFSALDAAPFAIELRKNLRVIAEKSRLALAEIRRRHLRLIA